MGGYVQRDRRLRSPVLTFAEAPFHPHMAAREAFREVGGHWQPGLA